MQGEDNYEMKKRIYFLSLGCPRNIVDSEIMLGLLKEGGCEILEQPHEDCLAVINTCGFIDEAVEESLEVIQSVIRLKERREVNKIVICGCLVQRFGKDLFKKMPLVDAFIGTNEITRINSVINEIFNGKRIFCCFKDKDFIYSGHFNRELITAQHTSYLKISEGCRQVCSYCVIAQLRGRYRSRPIENIVKEAEELAKKGVKEINLIGQETTFYGSDLYGKPVLNTLLKELILVKGISWIRLLYSAPDGFNRELIETIASCEKICKYADIPFQHISTKILKKMNKTYQRQDVINLITRLRNCIKGISLRATLMVGFPLEGEDDFGQMLEFVKWANFERLCVFKYSKEKDTPASKFKKQVPEKEKEQRYQKILELQNETAEKINQTFLGKKMRIMVDKANISRRPLSNLGNFNYSLGRTEFDAPESDGIVHVYSSKKLQSGTFVEAEIVDTRDYNLVGKALENDIKSK